MSKVTFTGDDGEEIEQTVLRILKDYLITELGKQPYAARLAKWKGATVTTTDEEASRYMSSAKPFIFLSIADGAHARNLYREHVGNDAIIGTQHLIDISAELVTVERCIMATKPLRDAVSDIITRGYNDLEELGLTNASIIPTSSNTAGVQLLNPYTVRVIAYSLPIPSTSASQP